MSLITPKYQYQPLERETLEGRRMYCCPDGSKTASVTTILSATMPLEKQKSLAGWRKRLGPTKAQEIVTTASSRGTRLHKYLELYVETSQLPVPGSNPYSQQSNKMAQIVIDSAFNNINEVWGSEVGLYYPQLYAGTTDLVAMWKGQPAILDFKQTNKPKKREWVDDYFLQLSAYILAHDVIHGSKINQGVILMCSADFEYQEFTLTGDELEHYKKLWWDRVEEYYSR